MTVRELIDALEREPHTEKEVLINLVSTPCEEKGENFLVVGDIDYNYSEVLYIDVLSSYGRFV